MTISLSLTRCAKSANGSKKLSRIGRSNSAPWSGCCPSLMLSLNSETKGKRYDAARREGDAVVRVGSDGQPGNAGLSTRDRGADPEDHHGHDQCSRQF